VYFDPISPTCKSFPSDAFAFAMSPPSVLAPANDKGDAVAAVVMGVVVLADCTGETAVTTFGLAVVVTTFGLVVVTTFGLAAIVTTFGLVVAVTTFGLAATTKSSGKYEPF
jgi:hypothetical protein